MRDVVRRAEALEGDAASSAAFASSVIASVIAVVMKPGAMAFTVTLREPISSASDFVKPMSAAFDAA